MTEWPFVEGALWGLVAQSSWLLESRAKGVFPVWVVCALLLTNVGMSVDLVDSLADWLSWLTVMTADMLLCRG